MTSPPDHSQAPEGRSSALAALMGGLLFNSGEKVVYMEEVAQLISNYGMSVVIIGYFLYKDYKFNQSIIDVLSEVRDVLTVLKDRCEHDH